MKSIKKEYPNRIVYENEKGLLHREDGPARIWKDGSKGWYLNGKRHRTDGPAIEMNNGDNSWFLNGQRFSKEDWEQEIAKIKLKRILDL